MNKNKNLAKALIKTITLILTFNLAVNLKDNAKVCIVDFDYQGSLLNIKDVSDVRIFPADQLQEAITSDFDFVFITDDRTSPRNDYDKFVAEQELKNIHRISADEMNYLRQLFKFNGIPRYIVINKEGKVWNDDFQMHNFEFELPKYLTKQP